MGFPDSSGGKESTCNAGDPGLIRGSGRSPGEGIGYLSVFLGFSCGSAGKESACNVRDVGLIPVLGRSPGEGTGYPLWYFGLNSSMDRIVHGVTKSQKWLRDFHFQEEERLYVDSKEADICKPGRNLSERAESAWPMILPLPGLEMPLSKL